jgi:hypothetical protein
MYLPGKVEQQLLEHSLQKVEILSSEKLSLNLEDSESGPVQKSAASPEALSAYSPCMHRRVDIAKVPLVSGKRTVGLHVPFSSHQIQLLLGESGVNHGERNAMESGVPASRALVAASSPIGHTYVANQGYSHLSGIDKISLICICFHSCGED